MVGGVIPSFPSNFGMSDGSLVGIAGHVASCNIGSLVSLVRSRMLREAKYGICSGVGMLVPAMVCCEPDPWWGLGGLVLPPWEEVGPPLPCKGERVTVWPWELGPSKVEPNKADPEIVALTGVCEGGIDERVWPDTPPKIGGRLNKRRERRGFCGSPMMSG